MPEEKTNKAEDECADLVRSGGPDGFSSVFGVNSTGVRLWPSVRSDPSLLFRVHPPLVRSLIVKERAEK